DVVSNNEELRLNLDLLEERRERAAICEAKAKLKMTKYYNARVRGVTFKPGDFAYRSNDASHVVAGGKLGPKWEGPYEVTEEMEHTNCGPWTEQFFQGHETLPILKDVTSKSRLTHGFQLRLGLAYKEGNIFGQFVNFGPSVSGGLTLKVLVVVDSGWYKPTRVVPPIEAALVSWILSWTIIG
nr:reverse transcriptase domain-containing protein [Tanacetum cinerariifolium]